MAESANWTPLHVKFHQTCRQRNLLEQQQSLLVAVSGGQDSLCLLGLLRDLQPKWNWQLAVAHCDHRWATDAGIADRVREIASRWGLPFHLKIASNLEETEAAARKWRYRALAEIARAHNCSAVVAGHTLSDRAETLLYNLIRGSGTDGLQALTWQRPLSDRIQLIRPLLNISRRETGAFCQQLQLPVWEDAANQDLRYARNRLRQQVIPQLQASFNPQVETAIAQTAEVLRADVEYLETQARKLLESAIAPPTASLVEPLSAQEHQPLCELPSLDRRVLSTAPLALQRRALRQFMQQFLKIAPSFAQIEALTQLLHAPNRSRTSTFPGQVVAEVQGNFVAFNQLV